MSLMDNFATLMGRPDPTVQLMAALGQAPGQPGGGPPVAGAPPPPQPGQQGGPQGGPQGAPPQGGQGAPQGTPPATMPNGQPAPQAFQSPSDLGQMYMTMVQRQQASNQFNMGLGLLAASAYPGRRPDIIMNAMRGMNQQDPSEMFGNLIKLQQFGEQQQNYQAMRAAIPGMLEKAGIDQSFAPLAMANPDILSKILETQAGVGGSPAWQAQMHAEKALTSQGQPIPWTPGDPDSYNAYKIRTDKEAADQQKDLNADRANFKPALDAYDNTLADLEKLKNDPHLGDILGGTNQYKTKGMTGLTPGTANALSLYDKIMGGQYAAGVQDFKGAGRITQQELKQDLPSQSTMPNRNTDVASFQDSINQYEQKLQQKRAQLFGASGQLANPALSDQDYDKYVGDIYKPGGSLYVKDQKGRPAPQPASPNDVAAPNAQTTSEQTKLKPLSGDDLTQAKSLIARDGRDAVIAHLKANGYDTSGL